MSKTETKAKPLTERMLSILVAPVITEKSTMGSQYSQVTFKVAPDATKPEIKDAVETVYKVKVKSVNTTILKGKTKRFRGVAGVRSDVKKAIVTLEAGQQIDVSTGV